MELSEQAKKIVLGKYRHYKGENYEALGVGFNSETLEEVVIYRALYGEKNLWVRPLKMFIEDVEIDGQTIPRFKFINE